jgi:hypothetical protein
VGVNDDLRRYYASLPDEALAEAYAEGEASYRPEAWAEIVSAMAARELHPESSTPEDFGGFAPPAENRKRNLEAAIARVCGYLGAFLGVALLAGTNRGPLIVVVFGGAIGGGIGAGIGTLLGAGINALRQR